MQRMKRHNTGIEEFSSLNTLSIAGYNILYWILQKYLVYRQPISLHVKFTFGLFLVLPLNPARGPPVSFELLLKLCFICSVKLFFSFATDITLPLSNSGWTTVRYCKTGKFDHGWCFLNANYDSSVNNVSIYQGQVLDLWHSRFDSGIFYALAVITGQKLRWRCIFVVIP